MSGQAERRHKAKMHYLCRGRADCLVALADLLGWTEGKTFAMAKQVGVEAADLREARARVDAYRDEVAS